MADDADRPSGEEGSEIYSLGLIPAAAANGKHLDFGRSSVPSFDQPRPEDEAADNTSGISTSPI